MGPVRPRRGLLRDLLLLAAALYFAIPPARNRLHPPGFVSTTILDRNGVKLREVLSDHDGVAKWAPLSDISPYLVQATIGIEDKRFYRHAGIDLIGLARAVRTDLKARRLVAGGSTITQQLIHNLYGFPRRNVWCKIIEAVEALRFEMNLSKNQILEAYLNRVPYANQVFGAEAAARTYFRKSCTELSLAEAAYLAAIPRSPRYYDPYRNPDRVGERERTIIREMARQHLIGDDQEKRALAEQLSLTPKEQNFLAPHFTDWILKAQEFKSSRVQEPEIRTTLDISIQTMVETRLKKNVRSLRGNNVTNGAVIVMKPETGEILAMAGSADYFDAKNDGQVNAALARRQPGSALKPFTYELALEDGATASELLPDLELAATENSGDFMPRNYDEKFHGPVRLRTALACSYNIPAVRVAERISPDRLLDRLHKLGFASLNRPASHYGLALTLGDGEVTLLELCRAYAALANGGRYTTECAKPGADRKTSDVMSPQAAFIITDILSDNTARAPAFGEYSVLNLGFPCAAKTGTSKDYRDNWTIGFTNEYLVGVWIGNFDGSPMHGVSGVTGAGPLFRDIMLGLHSEPPPPFVPPERLVRERICPKSGELCGPDCPGSITEWYLSGSEPTGQCSVHERYALDRRTGLPAGNETPLDEVEEAVFEVYPPLYYGWMQSVGLPFPPNPEREMCDGAAGSDSATLAAAQSANGNSTGSLAIVFPTRNSVFKRDPDLAAEFQSVELSAVVPRDCQQVTWSVDDSLLASAGPPFTAFWSLLPGRHRIRCTDEGQRRSDEVSILVVN